MASSVSLNMPSRFRTVFEEASRTTGVKFDYLVHTAKRESGLNATAKAPTSSATGLFQFVEQTWLQTMKEDGPALGFGNAAQHIAKSGNKYVVRDPKIRQQILDMRNDPKASAMLAGALAQKNEATLEQRLNRTPSSGELYAAHFLGAQGSGRLIELAHNKPGLEAYKIFPQQAAANRNIFFDRGGQPKTVSEVYENLVGTVPEKKNPLSRFFNLGNWFKPKASMQESRFAQADVSKAQPPQPTIQKVMIDLAGDNVTKPDAFFNQPNRAHDQAVPSRYSMSYSSSVSELSMAAKSRFAMEAEAKTSNAINERVSRVFADYAPSVVSSETAKSADTKVAATDATVPLPRRKPLSADTYVDALGDALPRPKPVKQSDGAISRPLDLTNRSQVGVGEEAPRQRFGALDLSAFLKQDVLSSTKNT